MSVTVLMVAEKPMLAESIARLLSDGRYKKKQGWNGACSISEYNGVFKGRAAKFKVTSTCGHVMSVDFPQKFNSWDSTDPQELYSAPILKVEANPKLKMPTYLASEAKGADYLVLWLDCDKEGENICFEVVDAVKASMNSWKSHTGDFMDVVYRAHFSAITERDIKEAMKNLGRPCKSQALSVDARQELDLRVGCSFTRFQTKYFQGKYGDLDSSVISYGPCQTPTLGFCVKRHDEIIHFKPVPYWVLQTSFRTQNGELLKPESKTGRLFDKGAATSLLNNVKKIGSAEVANILTKEARKDRPQALNTVELLRIASSALGISPTSTMSTAEHLYTQGYISYPRTETTSYPANFDLRGTLKQQEQDPRWGTVVKEILMDGIHKPRGGADKGDHPPITPMRPSNGQLSGDMARIYDYVTQHFIATLMSPCIYEISTVTLLCQDENSSESFTIQCRSTISPGFTKILTWKDVDDGEDSRVPRVTKGEKLELETADLTQRYTSPPGYLTESELITLMEKHGIGTDASIPVHINTICQRNYVTVETGRRLVPTKLGISLVHGYWKVDQELVLPTMRARLEKRLNEIAEGKAEYDEVRKTAVAEFHAKFNYYVKNILLVDGLFEACFTSLARSGKPFSKCGKCNRFMKLIESRPQRLYCMTCEETYSVPHGKDGNVQTHGDRKCPVDGFDLLYYQGPGGKLSRSFAFCPYCYNNPPFESMKSSSGCDRCPHPTCSYSFVKNSLCACPTGCGSSMVLDPKSQPKWRFTCQRCPSVIAVFEGANKIKVTDQPCEKCSAQILSIEYKDSVKSCLPEHALNWKGCVFCDETVSEQLNMHHAYLTEEQRHQQTCHRGSGRGRRNVGRGRRRGQKGNDDDVVDSDLKSYIFRREANQIISLGDAGGGTLSIVAAAYAPADASPSDFVPQATRGFEQRGRSGGKNRGRNGEECARGFSHRGRAQIRNSCHPDRPPGRGHGASRKARGSHVNHPDADVEDLTTAVGNIEFRRGGGRGNRPRSGNRGRGSVSRQAPYREKNNKL